MPAVTACRGEAFFLRMTGGAAARPGYRLRSFQERGELRTRMERAKQSVAGFCRQSSGSRRGTQPLAGAWHMAPPPESGMKKRADPGRDRSGVLKRDRPDPRTAFFCHFPPAGLAGLNSRPRHPCPLSPPAGARRFFANDRGCSCAAHPGYWLRSFQERGELRTRMERAKQSVAGFCRQSSGSRRGTQPLAGAWHMAPPPESGMKKRADPGRDRSGAFKRDRPEPRAAFSVVSPPAGLAG